MTVEQILQKHYPSDEFSLARECYEDVLIAMKEYAKQEAEQAWDAAIDYARDCSDWSVSNNALVGKETYLEKYTL